MLKINSEFRSLIPPLLDSEYKELEQSILAEGCREPLCVWNDTIVDGHHRYEICTKYSLPFQTKEISFGSEGEAKIWIITNQLARRNITDFTRIELKYKRKDILLAMGREKKQIAGKEARDKQLGVLSNLDKTPTEPHDTRKIIADELDIGSGTLARAEQIIKYAPEELKEKLRSGDISINKAYGEIRHSGVEEPPPFPNGKFRIIYADPPWFYAQQIESYGPAERHYPTMKTIEIPQDLLQKINCHKSDDTSKKGKAAVEITRYLLLNGKISFPFIVKEVTEKNLQVRGVDLIITSQIKIEVKCDWLGGKYGLALQTHECNPFKKY